MSPFAFTPILARPGVDEDDSLVEPMLWGASGAFVVIFTAASFAQVQEVTAKLGAANATTSIRSLGSKMTCVVPSCDAVRSA